MKRFFQMLLLLWAVSISSAFAQTSQKQFNIQFPSEGFPINVQKMPEEFPKSLVMFMAMDLENKVAPVDVDVCLVGPNLTDEFKLSSNKGAQRSYSALQLNGDIEITITKAGYKTIKTKLKIEGRSAVAIRLDKEYTTQQISYKVGDYYNDGTKEGVVFWVDATGKHGKIVSMRQEMLEWCTREQCDKGITVGVTSKTDGKINTDKIMKRADKNQYPAFIWCGNLGEDWYLPSIEELKLLLCDHNVRYAINNTLENKGGIMIFAPDVIEKPWYVSSTEGDGLDARYFVWYYLMDTSNMVTMSQKNQSGTVAKTYVRAIATF